MSFRWQFAIVLVHFDLMGCFRLVFRFESFFCLFLCLVTHTTAPSCSLQCCRFLTSWSFVVIGTSSLRSAVVFSGGSLCEIRLTVIVITFEDMLMFSCSPFRLY